MRGRGFCEDSTRPDSLSFPKIISDGRGKKESTAKPMAMTREIKLVTMLLALIGGTLFTKPLNYSEKHFRRFLIACPTSFPKG
jgi:hypothetical protein